MMNGTPFLASFHSTLSTVLSISMVSTQPRYQNCYQNIVISDQCPTLSHSYAGYCAAFVSLQVEIQARDGEDCLQNLNISPLQSQRRWGPTCALSYHIPSTRPHFTFVTLNVPVNVLDHLESLHHLHVVVPNTEQQGGEAVVVQKVDVDVLHLTEPPDNVVVSEETGLHENSPVFSPGASAPGDQVHIDVRLAQQELQQFRVIPVCSNPQSWVDTSLSQIFTYLLYCYLISFCLLIRC